MAFACEQPGVGATLILGDGADRIFVEVNLAHTEAAGDRSTPAGVGRRPGRRDVKRHGVMFLGARTSLLDTGEYCAYDRVN